MFSHPDLLEFVVNAVMVLFALGLVATVTLWLARPVRTVNPFVLSGKNQNFHSGLTETLS